MPQLTFLTRKVSQRISHLPHQFILAKAFELPTHIKKRPAIAERLYAGLERILNCSEDEFCNEEKSDYRNGDIFLLVVACAKSDYNISYGTDTDTVSY